jgi:SAM-dependent methyltransferase
VRIGSTRTAKYDRPGQANVAIWTRRSFVGAYANRVLRPAEVLQLVRHREALGGRVLELGSGAGRVSGYLLGIASELHAIDVSAAMVEYCSARYPGGRFEIGDLRDLSMFATSSFDSVVAADNVIDVLGDDERRRVLRELLRVLAPGGLLIMSSHNRAHLPQIAGPMSLDLRLGPLRVARRLAGMPVLVRNHRRGRALERNEPLYALVNDGAHRYSLIHYYVARDDQARQFTEEGYGLVECLDREGAVVGPGDEAAASPELYYAARSLRKLEDNLELGATTR